MATQHIKHIETNYAHDTVTITATKPDKNEEDFLSRKVEMVFAGRDPATISLRYTDVRDVRAIAHALLDAADYLDQQR